MSFVSDLSHAVRPRQESKCNDADRIDYIVSDPITAHEGRTWSHAGNNTSQLHNVIPDVAWALQERDHKGADSDTKLGHLIVAHTLRADGFDASEDGTGRGAPLVLDTETTHALANLGRNITEDGTSRGLPIIPILEAGARQGKPDLRDGLGIGKDGDPMFTLESGKQHAISFTERSRPDGRNLEFQDDIAYALTNPGSGGRTHSRQVMQAARVRRLTPLECEKLQGFPDNYTRIKYRGKVAADGPRYRALGNSMAVPVVHWIGERIQAVEELLIKLRATDT